MDTEAARRIDITAARGLYEVPAGIYLLSHAVGAMPRVARAAAERYLSQWSERACDAWWEWLGDVDAFNAAIAELINAQPSEVCPQVNLSAGLSKVLQALPRRHGRTRLIFSELDFPTMGFVGQQAARLGYDIEFVPHGAPDPRLTRLDGDVQLLHLTHAYSDNGYAVPDVAAAVSAAREAGAYIAVDVAQSVGVLAVDAAGWGADFILGSSVKWLCGGQGAAFLWVRQDLIEQLEPQDVGWFSHARPFDLDIRSFEYAPTAKRFWGGTPSILPFQIATAAIRQLNAIGLESIRGHNRELCDKLIAAAAQRGIAVVSPENPAERSGTVVLAYVDPDAQRARLGEAGVHVDQRRFGLRLSPHLYTTAEEVERVCELL
jgi:kynureninase